MCFPPSYCTSCSVSNEQPSSKRVEKEAVTPASIATVWAERREVCLHGCLDLNGNIHTSRPAAVVSWDRAEAQTCHRENKASLEDLKISSDESQHLISGGRRFTLIKNYVVHGKTQLEHILLTSKICVMTEIHQICLHVQPCYVLCGLRSSP